MKKRVFVIVTVSLIILFIYSKVFSTGVEGKGYVDFPEADYSKGEEFIYGTILKVDYEKRRIIIEQHLDHKSQEISSILNLRKDAVIILKRNDKYMNIDFYDLKPDDVFGIVLDSHSMVRGIIIFV